MIEKPKPLSLGFGLDPKQTLKTMLEMSDKKDRGESFPSPLNSIDPMTLDELNNRIDTGALALGQVPDPKDVAKLVSIYWSLRDQFVLEQQLGIVNKPKKAGKNSISVPPGTSVMDLLK